MTDPNAAPPSPERSADGWRIRRICIAGACGAILSGSNRFLDFWPLGAGGSLGFTLRGLLELLQLLFVLPLGGLVLGLLIAACIAPWRRRFRRAASSILAIAAIPLGFMVVARVPLFDPWLWYTLANRTRLEAFADSKSPSSGPKYAVVATRDVSTGLAGVSPNHFIVLIYDQSDEIGLDPTKRSSIWQTRSMNPEEGYVPMPRGRKLFGHFFRVDEYE